jgi:hypothetical protein
MRAGGPQRSSAGRNNSEARLDSTTWDHREIIRLARPFAIGRHFSDD